MVDLLFQIQDSITVPAVDSVVQVQQHVGGFRDLVRLYVIPGLGTLFLGLCALLLEWLRRQMKHQADKQARATELKARQDERFQEILTETNARVLIAAANAKVAADKSEALQRDMKANDEERGRELREIKQITTTTQHQTNEAAERAQRQIDALSRQLMREGIEPKKGNGGGGP